MNHKGGASFCFNRIRGTITEVDTQDNGIPCSICFIAEINKSVSTAKMMTIDPQKLTIRFFDGTSKSNRAYCVQTEELESPYGSTRKLVRFSFMCISAWRCRSNMQQIFRV